jgi:hypothetical protein
MEVKKVVFSFDEMIASLRGAMDTFPDLRTGKNTQYEIADAASGAFSVFFTQCPSFLEHQKMMQQRYGLSNAKTLFGMHHIPSNNHIRNLLDNVPPSLLAGVFHDCFTALKKSGDLDTYRMSLGNNRNDLLIAIDGTQYAASDSLHCANCSKKTKDGKDFYAHTMVTPTIVAPGKNKVISLLPECITPQDGDTKQDCELKASKRWLASNEYGTEGVTILGDDLYAHEPFCLELLDKGMNFILVCKPESHQTVYEWSKGSTTEKVVDRFDGKKHLLYTYNYLQDVPLRNSIKKGETPLLVNFVEVTITDRKTGKQVYHNAFITNHALEGKTDQETKTLLTAIVDCGRARWKIENENNNTLKTQGYHLEHNFGHGEKYLAALFATMNILAFLFHTMLEFMDGKYQLLRKALGARKRLFEHIRVLLIHIPATNFEHFLTYMIESMKRPIPIEELTFPV